MFVRPKAWQRTMARKLEILVRDASLEGWGLAVPSLYPMPRITNLQIVQNRAYVRIITGMNHDVRILKLSGNHNNNDFNSWVGDSIGFWKDDTLVVHTVNFRPEQSNFLMAISAQLEITKRFNRATDTEALCRCTSNNPPAYTQAFKVERTIALRKLD